MKKLGACTGSIAFILVVYGCAGMPVHQPTKETVQTFDPVIDECFALVDQNRFAEALNICERAVNNNPDSFIAHVSFGKALAWEGRSDYAEEMYRVALDIDPDVVSARMELGILLKDNVKYHEALSEFREVIRRRPEYFQAHVEKANVYRLQKNWSRAADMFRQAAELHSEDESLRSDFVEALVNAGRQTEALSAMNSASSDFPGSADLAFRFGVILQEQQRYQDAIAQYNRVLRLSPDNNPARFNLALCHFQNRNIREAERVITVFLQRQPNSSSGNFLAGQIAFSVNNVSEAEMFFRRSIELDRNNGASWVMLGNILRQRNDRQGAAESYRQALRINPDDETARRNLRRVY